MIPAKKDSRDYLRCIKCKYEMEAKPSAKKEYTVKESKGKSERVLTTSIVSETSPRTNEEQLEQEREEYYREVGLELLRDELEGGEEETSED